MADLQQTEVELQASRLALRGLTPNGTAPTIEHDLIRPDDQVRLRFSLINGHIDPATNTIRFLGEEPIYYAITVGSQHTVEPAIPAGTDPAVPATSHRVAGESRIVIEVPDGTPFTVEKLLDFGAFALHLDERAAGGKAPTNDEPAGDVTAIEVPAGLVLTPTPGSIFSSSSTPKTLDDVTERWSARLGKGRVNRPSPLPNVRLGGRLRALYQRPGDPPWTVPVEERHRQDLVDQTSQDDALRVDKLLITPHGADVDLNGNWDTGNVAYYSQRARTGRDLRVVVAERGFIAPFGHAATLTTITERRIEDDTEENPTATLFNETYLTITNPTVAGPTNHVAAEGRELPFISVRASDTGSGPVGEEQMQLDSGVRIPTDRAHIVTRDTATVAITYTGTDRDGNDAITFDLPAVFVANSVAYDPRKTTGVRRTPMQRITRWYIENPDMADAEIGGQPIAWAESPADGSRAAAGSVQDTDRIEFRLERPVLDGLIPADVETELRDTGRAAFSAAVSRAWVIDRAAATTTGNAQPTVEVEVAPRYLDFGTTVDNIDLGYLDLVAPTVTAPSTEGDGLLSTALHVSTFGQALGGSIDLPGGNWDPAEALAGLPRLLGLIDLPDLLLDINLNELDLGQIGGGDSGLPTLEVEIIPGDDPFDLPTGVCLTLSWRPDLKSYPTNADKPTFIIATSEEHERAGLPTTPTEAYGKDGTEAILSMETCVPGETTVEVAVNRFAVQAPPFIPVIAVLFDQLRVRDVGGSTTVEAKIADWIFVGALGWLEPVKDLLIDGLGLGTPSFEDGIDVDFDLPIPSLKLGVVGVSQIQMGLGISLPSNEASEVSFNLSAREDPFVITVFGVGGTGSFIVVVDAGKIVLVEGSLGVTYELAVDVFIVSAAVSIELGAFVRYEIGKNDEPEVTLGAYAKVAGAASILGLVEISGSVTVGLIYNVNNKVLKGTAAVTGEVSSIFGTSSVTRDVEVKVSLDKDDSGARSALNVADEDAPLSFGDRFQEQSDWTTYCDAFVAA